jgi:hypothetical protein
VTSVQGAAVVANRSAVRWYFANAGPLHGVVIAVRVLHQAVAKHLFRRRAFALDIRDLSELCHAAHRKHSASDGAKIAVTIIMIGKKRSVSGAISGTLDCVDAVWSLQSFDARYESKCESN